MNAPGLTTSMCRALLNRFSVHTMSGRLATKRPVHRTVPIKLKGLTHTRSTATSKGVVSRPENSDLDDAGKGTETHRQAANAIEKSVLFFHRPIMSSLVGEAGYLIADIFQNAPPFRRGFFLVAGDARLERATSGSGDQRSIQLS